MLINWFTVLAQIVNFLILIYLLRRFLFKPILRAMAEREKNMVETLNRAEQAEQKAQQKARELEEAKEAFARDRETLMAEAREQVAKWREDTLKGAREEIETLRGTWIASVNRDRQAFLDGLKQRMVEQVVHIGGKVILDLADQTLNRQVLRVFLEKVSASRNELEGSRVKGNVLLQSGIPLETDDVTTLRQGLARWFPEEMAIQLEPAPELGFGIQLVAGDRKVSWHLRDYLEDLEKEIMENLFKDARMTS